MKQPISLINNHYLRMLRSLMFPFDSSLNFHVPVQNLYRQILVTYFHINQAEARNNNGHNKVFMKVTIIFL